jgi:hypothetical protein
MRSSPQLRTGISGFFRLMKRGQTTDKISAKAQSLRAQDSVEVFIIYSSSESKSPIWLKLKANCDGRLRCAALRISA